jgi:hypothetical protein
VSRVLEEILQREPFVIMRNYRGEPRYSEGASGRLVYLGDAVEFQLDNGQQSRLLRKLKSSVNTQL